jgi:NAD(P)-dependent dehydrogenase (short-subunit alcohol dehydrogenase family)
MSATVDGSEFDGKVALVTGGAYGLGRATAVLLADRGARVAVVDIDGARGRETTKMIEEVGGVGLLIEADVRREDDVARAVGETVSEFGGLDIGVNNAGITHRSAAVTELEDRLFDDLFDTNVKGVWLGMKYQIPELLKRGGGAIVNVSSAWATTGAPGMAFYVATKHAIVGLTRSAALEFIEQGVRVNCVCPGGIKTGILEEFARLNPDLTQQTAAAHPIGRNSEPQEIAEAIAFLASQRASFAVGSAFTVDGGYTVP